MRNILVAGGYAYILIPSGLENKARVTARFLRRKIAEYEKLQIEIEHLFAGLAVTFGLRE